MQSSLPLPGDVVWIRRRRWRIERATRDRNVVRLDVAWRERRRTFLSPFDRIMQARPAGRRVVRSQEALARLAGSIARAPDHRLPLALLDAAADVLPHQIEPVLAAVAGHSRLLIADEVGLGKTVQAGLIVAELLRRQPAPRALILAPASLRDQWQVELRHRFNVECLRADRRELELLSAEGAFGANPWHRSGVWLASPDFVKQMQVLGSLPRDPWDLIVIDEAHAVCGDSDRYAACHTLAKRSRRVLLLTATPHSGDASRFARLLALGGIDGDVNPPIVFRRTREDLGLARARHVRWHSVTLRDAESRTLAELAAFEHAALHAAGTHYGEGARLLLSVFRKRALSTFAALSRSLSRRLQWLGDEDAPGVTGWTQTTLAFDDCIDEDESSELAGLTASTGMDPRLERRWIKRLRQLTGDACRAESKIFRLQSLVERSTEPVVVFSEFRDSLEAVESRLRRSRSIALIHGGQDQLQQRSELDRYLSGPASVLLATDVAGQGLNLQSRGRWVISLELPWNPARLEQRLGRVDRLGQTRTPHLTLLVARHDAESGLLSHLSRRILSAQNSFSTDLLRDVAPPQSEVRVAMFSNPAALRDAPSEQPTDAAGAPVVNRRWRRAASVVARAMTRRRRLVDRWKGAAGDATRIIYARVPRRWNSPLARLPEERAATSIVVCSVPVVDGQGELVERRLVALTMPAAVAALRPVELVAHIRSQIEDSLARRLARLSRLTRQAASRRAAREIAIATPGSDDCGQHEGQAGLFDSRELKSFLDRRSAEARLEASAQLKLERLQSDAALRLGEIEIEFVLGCGQ